MNKRPAIPHNPPASTASRTAAATCLIKDESPQWKKLLAAKLLLSMSLVTLSALAWTAFNAAGQQFFKWGIYQPAGHCFEAAAQFAGLACKGDDRRQLSLRNLAAVYTAQDRDADASRVSTENRLPLRPYPHMHLNDWPEQEINHWLAARPEQFKDKQISDLMDDMTELEGLIHCCLQKHEFTSAQKLETLASNISKYLGRNKHAAGQVLIGSAVDYIANGWLEEARDHLLTAESILASSNIDVSADQADAWHNLARVYMSEGRYADAEAYYQKCLAVTNPVWTHDCCFGTCLMGYSELLERTNRPERAQPLAQRATELGALYQYIP